MKLITSWLKINRTLAQCVFAGALVVSFIALANSPRHALAKSKLVAAKGPVSSVVLDYPSTISQGSGPDYNGPLGPGGGGVGFQAGDRLDQTFLNSGFCFADSSEWKFQMSNFTGNTTNTFDVFINDVKVGSYSFNSGDGNPINFDLVFSHPGLAVGTAKLSIVATSTVPGGQGSWNWIAGGTVTLFGSASGCPCAPAPAGMVSWWKAEGDANDSQGNNNGTIGGATFATGEVGQAFSFDGVDDYVDAGNSASINLTGSQVTIDAWINPSADLSTESWFFGKSGDGTVRYAIEWEPGDPGTLIGRANTGAVQANFTPPTNTWTHVAVVYDGNAEITTKLYVNGMVIASGSPSSGNLTPSAAPFVIGAFDSTHTRNFNGLVDEVELFDRALSDSEVASIYIAGSAGKCPCTPAPTGMIGWWPGDGNTDDIQDSNNGIFIGTPAYGSGEVRQAFSFNGDPSNYVSIGNPSNLKPTSGITLDAWINLNAVDGDGRAGIITKWGQGSEDNWAIWAEQGEGSILLDSYIVTSIGYSESFGGSIPIGAWTHVALTYDAASGTQTVYVNGVSVGTSSLPPGTTLSQTNAEVCIGRECTSNPRPFNGLIDEVEVFDRALSAGEIAAIYNAGGAGKCRTCTPAPAGMAGWWPGNGNTNDVIGHNDGTLQNGATFGPGEVDQGFSLDGQDDSVTTNQTISTNNEITLDAWINPSTLSLGWPVGPVVFEKGADILNRIGMQIKTDGSLCG
jgi:hypothetical protein